MGVTGPVQGHIAILLSCDILAHINHTLALLQIHLLAILAFVVIFIYDVTVIGDAVAEQLVVRLFIVVFWENK